MIEPQQWIIDELRRFDPTLTMVYNPNWMENWDKERDCYDDDTRYLIAQVYVEAEGLGGGYWHFKRVWFPILPAGRNGGQEWDRRWLQILRENHISSDSWDPMVDIRAKQREADERWENYIEDYVIDRGHWMMKRQYRDHRIPGVRDPMRKIYEQEDRTGEVWTPDFGNDGFTIPWA
jgi:hypothetical protein